jgi:ubiquinone/menaquinone biosynthesis C-methylase UbiE
MAENNPAYQDLIRRFEACAHGWQIPPGATLVDIGAGTGNFSLPLARLFPRCPVVHLDAEPDMNAAAERKARRLGLGNITFRTENIAQVDFPAGSVAAVVAVHCLYAFASPGQVLGRVRRWLRPQGYLYACDPGQSPDMLAWSSYIFRESCKRRGLIRTVGMFYRGRIVAQQNRRIAAAQRSGRYWRHSHEVFCRTLRDAGFSIAASEKVYRGCSDLAVCRPRVP